MNPVRTSMLRAFALRPSARKAVLLPAVALALLAATPALAAHRTARKQAFREAARARTTKTKAKPAAKPKTLTEKLAPSRPDNKAALAEDAAPLTARGPTHVDFDERLVEGQANKTGAVYLFDRKETQARSMVQARKSYRDELLRTVYE